MRYEYLIVIPIAMIRLFLCNWQDYWRKQRVHQLRGTAICEI